MIVRKITTGFVVQNFDTEKQKFISQEFVAGDQVEVEVDGEPIDSSEVEGLDETYLPFDMVQPENKN